MSDSLPGCVQQAYLKGIRVSDRIPKLTASERSSATCLRLQDPPTGRFTIHPMLLTFAVEQVHSIDCDAMKCCQ